jgi:NodT family efflux transporter outer membrane factor (OMF) lipoprotein
MIRKSIAALATLALAACAGAGPYHAPDLPLAPGWSAANAAPRSAPGEWWHTFDDPVLDRLITAGLAGNADLAGALARLDQARAAAGGTQAAQLPTVQTQDTVARQRQSIDSGLGRLVPYVPGLSRVQNQGDLGVSATWDIDFAGGLASASRAAQAEAGAAQAGLAASRLAIAAEIADAYFDWRSARADRALLMQQRDLVDQQLHLADARVARGDAARRDGDEADAARAAFDAVLPQVDRAVTIARNRIAVLTGRPAGTDVPELAGIDEGAALPTAREPAAGTPAEIVRNRPDLVLAEARLRASHARIGAALAEYWPRFSLSALFGFTSNDLSLLGANSANVITGAVGLRWRLFDFGRINAEVAAARGAEREALAAYRGAVLAAGGDVENAFVTLGAARRTLTAREAADASADRLLAQMRARHRAGDASRIDLVVAQTRRIDAARALLAAHADVAMALVACHRALGG